MIIVIKQENEKNIEIQASELAKLDTSLGLTYYGGKNGHQEDSFSQKLWKNLEKILKQSHIEENVFHVLSNSLNYLYKDMKANFLSDICIELNIPKVQKSLLNKITNFFHSENKENVLKNTKNNIFLDKKYVNIDLSLDNGKASNYLKNLKKLYSEEEYFQLVLFHQLGHMLDYANESNKQLYTDYFTSIREKINKLNFTNACIVNDQMLAFNIDPELSPIDSTFVNNLQKMEREMYADTASILFKYNFNSSINKEDKEALLEKDIDNVIECRLEAYKQLKINLQEKDIPYHKILENISYLTTFALEDIKETLLEHHKTENNDALTEEQIHALCLKQTEKGMLKYMLLAAQNSPHIKKQLNTIFSLEVDDLLGILEYKDGENYQKSQNVWTKIINNIKPEWLKNSQQIFESSITQTIDNNIIKDMPYAKDLESGKNKVTALRNYHNNVEGQPFKHKR